MNKEGLRAILTDSENACISWKLRKHSLSPEEETEGDFSFMGPIKPSEADNLFYQCLSVYECGRLVDSEEWPLGIAGEITNPATHQVTELQLLKIISRGGLIIPKKNYLNLFLDPVDSTRLPEGHDYTRIIGRFLGGIKEYDEFRHSFRQVGCWDYEMISGVLVQLLRLYKSAPILEEELDFGDSAASLIELAY